ncbi:hypothetical protein Droror1_Dr00011929 [Drosera rotundifolia]
MVYDYYASGAEDQWTLAENRNAFSRILFRPRILIDVSNIDMSTTVLGFKISMPIMIAPTAMQKMVHPEGEYATARAASAAGTIMFYNVIFFLLWYLVLDDYIFQLFNTWNRGLTGECTVKRAVVKGTYCP